MTGRIGGGVQEVMSDLISRQAAIDALIKWYGYEPSDIGAFENIIDKLPSAQPEPCEDAVSRKAVYDAMVEKGQCSRRYKLGEIWELNGTEIREALDTVPSVTPKRKTGKWIADNHDFWVCSNCKFPSEAHGANILYKFCPNCGADMRGADDE